MRRSQKTSAGQPRGGGQSAIPMIDLAGLIDGDDRAAVRVAGRIRRTAIDTGFFYVVNHGVPPLLQAAVLMAAKYFFALPEARKTAIRVNAAHRGYIPFGQTRLDGAAAVDLKESFNFAFDFPPNAPEFVEGRTLVGTNQWPDGEPAWRAIVVQYYDAMLALGRRLLQGIALSLGLERDFFSAFYTRPLVRARLLRYPPLTKQADTWQLSAAPHTDYGCFTILWQDETGGLQVRDRRGRWLDAPPIEGSYVINIGDMLARWSNDLYVSTPHRVVNRTDRERFSIPVFFDPNWDTVVACLPSCTGPGRPAKYAPIRCGEYLTARYDRSYAYRQ